MRGKNESTDIQRHPVFLFIASILSFRHLKWFFKMKETKNESEFWFYFATMSDLTRSVVSMGLYNIEEKFKHFQNIIQGLTGLIIQES